MTTPNAAADERTAHLLEADRWLAKPNRLRGGMTTAGALVCLFYAREAVSKALEANRQAQTVKPRKGDRP